ncbi:hypothetical protein K4K57_012191 [Colletotrichum sp. SAR 10_99]|nr:hypothetical protein K4K55_011914 [Colletotrichum sp. SAR 10_96]KAJ5016085.1 hypothetical protein K4K57_012191 [Colletotrichum sp. SAR 10_99]
MAFQADISATEQPNEPTILASYDDLTDHEKRSCDSIITHILTLNRTGKPLPNFVANRIKEYKWTDSNNKNIGGAKAITLTDRTLQEAKVEAIIKRDQKELDRVGRLNIDVAVYYAREQLLSHLKLNRRDGSRKKRCKACKMREVSGMKEFQEIRLCGDFIAAHQDLSAGYFAHEKQPLVGPSFM